MSSTAMSNRAATLAASAASAIELAAVVRLSTGPAPARSTQRPWKGRPTAAPTAKLAAAVPASANDPVAPWTLNTIARLMPPSRSLPTSPPSASRRASLLRSSGR